MFQCFLRFCVVLWIVWIEKSLACQINNLHASEEVAFIDSHLEFDNNGAYHNHMYVCWNIRAPADHVIAAWTSEQFQLERGYDFLNLFCGHYGDEGHIGKYTGNQFIPEEAPVHTGNNFLYVEFETDFSITDAGFRLFYKAIPANETAVNDCQDNSDYDYEVHVHYHVKKDKPVSAGSIIGIIIGVLVMIALIIGIVFMFICFSSRLKAMRSRNVNMANSVQMGQVQNTSINPAGYANPQYVASPVSSGYNQSEGFTNLAGFPQYQEGEEQKSQPPPDYATVEVNTATS